jgi:hypothetical protein
VRSERSERYGEEAKRGCNPNPCHVELGRLPSRSFMRRSGDIS